MKTTNKTGLPGVWVDAVNNINDKYSKGEADYTATDLLKPVRQLILTSRYYDELEEDVSDMTWRVLGQLMHQLMDNMNDDNALVEERLFAEIQGKKIGGKFDRYENDELKDYKLTSSWKYVFENKKPVEKRWTDWTEQLNIYAYLLRVAGFDPKRLSCLVVFRDWSKNNALQNSAYPQSNIIEIDLPIWTYDEQEKFITDRVNKIMHSDATEKDDNLPYCTLDEVWAMPEKWVCKKPENKKASKVCDTKDHAEKWIESQKIPSQFIIENRPGKWNRCQDYCVVNNYCNQYKEYLEKQNGE